MKLIHTAVHKNQYIINTYVITGIAPGTYRLKLPYKHVLKVKLYLVHIAARSNLMTTFCRLEEVDQLGIDVNLGMRNVISMLTKAPS